MKSIILCALAVIVTGTPLNSNRVFVRELNPSDEQNPSTLVMQLNDRVLNLKRRDEVNVDAPVFVVNEKGDLEKRETRSLGMAAYHDSDNGAAFLIKSEKRESGAYRRTVRGIISDGDYELHLQPEPEISDRKRDVDGAVSHTMERRKVEKVDNNKDTVKRDEPDEPPISDLEKRNSNELPQVKVKFDNKDDERKKRNSNELPQVKVKVDNKGSERRRSTQKVNYFIEFLMVVDSKAYSRFSSEDEAREYYLHIANGVNLRYANIHVDDISFTVTVAGLVFLKQASECSMIQNNLDGNGNCNAKNAMDNFRIWRSTRPTTGVGALPHHDHAMIFTGYDIFSESGSLSLAGLAYVSAICGDYAVSITEDLGGLKCITTAAHELGHNLGAGDHDGSDNGGSCPAEDKYIMTPSSGGTTEINYKNPFRFSGCSIGQFRVQLQTMNSQNRNCLKNQATSESPEVPYPGQKWGIDEQCVEIFGSGAKYIGGETPDTLICMNIRCWKPSTPDSTWTSGLALRGTTCGNKKWCVEGDCVSDANAPATDGDVCLYHDYAAQIVGDKYCAEVINGNNAYCYNEWYRSRCCKSCKAVKTDTQGCEYGDSQTWCKPEHCAVEANRPHCCKTCNTAGSTSTNQCIDNNVRFYFPDETHYSCSELVAMNKDYCLQISVKSNCCMSCE